MKAAPFLLPMLAACAAAAPPDPAPDPGPVLSRVIASEARIHGAEPPLCLQRKIAEPAFADRRNTLVGLRRDSSPGAERMRVAAASGEYDWTVPSAKPGEAATKTKLDAEQARALSAAAAAIIAEPAASPAVAAVDARWLAAPLHFCSGDGQLPRVYVSAPAFRGDIAFVETGFVCGGLCGNGLLYALRRRETGWEIVSVVDIWIS